MKRRRPATKAIATEPIVCMFGHFDPAYVRNRQVRDSLGSLGCRVVEAQAAGPVFRRWPRLVRATRGLPFDALWVAFLGYSDVPLAWVLSRRRRVPLVFDAFVLLHDTFVTDRGTVRRRSVAALFLRALEIVACHLADVVVIDTVDHAERLARRTRLDPARVHVLHVGSEHEAPCADTVPDEPFTVAYCGSYQPLHGVDVIVRAVGELTDEPNIRFVLVGDGQTKRDAVALAESLGCENVAFLESRHGDALRAVLCNAHVLLGAFGTSAKAAVVVPNKVVDALALGKPVITAATPAVERMLDQSQVRTVPAGDPKALAEAIRALASDPEARQRLGAAGRRVYEATFSPDARRLQLATILEAATS